MGLNSSYFFSLCLTSANPPFSLFREFVNWVLSAEKKIVVIGTQNAITYKEIFPLIKDDKLWLGATANNSDMVFGVPEGAKISEKDKKKAEKLGYVGNYTRLGNACWFTNIEHGRRHEELILMDRDDNLRYNKKLINKLKNTFDMTDYPKYDNYDAIEVSYVDAIPSDFDGIMGVPTTFLAKYNPDQFKLLGIMNTGEENKGIRYENTPHGRPVVNGTEIYIRILIEHRRKK